MYKQKFFARSITIAKETNKIKALAEKVGIVLPSIHTALFQSVFAPIDEANLNGVRLDNAVVEDEIKKMIGSQANMEHMGYGWIVGIILGAWINDANEIEIIYSFAKNIYDKEYILALEAMASGELAVSFELLAETDAQEQLTDGTILLHEYSFTGVGVLIENPPAYTNAKTYEFASAIKKRISNADNKELVFASQIEKTCDAILTEENKDNSTQGGNKNVTEEQKKQIKALRVELGEVAKDVKDEDLLNETIVAELREKYLAYKSDTVEIRTFSIVDNDGKSVIKENIKRTTKTDYNAMQEAQAKVKELETKVEELEASLTAKDSEIEVVRTNAEKIGTIKVQLKDNTFAKDFSDEDYLDEEKVAKAIQDKEDAEKIASLKEELKENGYAKDFSDADYLNEDKVESAKIKKENDELKARLPAEEIIATVVEEDNLETGTKTEETEDKFDTVMASIRTKTKENREEQKVYTREKK